MKSYKIKKSDSAATVPGRVTFPHGTHVPPPLPRIPYQPAPGTTASGLAGHQGAPYAMYPTQPQPPHFTWRGNQYKNWLQQGSQFGPLGTLNAAQNIATDLGGEVFSTGAQAYDYSVNQVNKAVDRAVYNYQDAYANVPNSVIQSLALVNPGMSLGLLNSRNAALRNRMGGRLVNRPGAPAPVYPNNLGYDPAMRGRGYQPRFNPNGFTPASIGVGNTGPGPGSYVLSEYGPDISYLTPEQLAWARGGLHSQALDPTQAYGGFQNIGGADNTDYANTAAAQYYAANGTPFTQQKRWDPQAKKFVSIGRLLKQGKLDLKGNWRRTSKRQRIGNAAQKRAQQQQPAPLNTSATAFVNFRV